MERIKGPKDTKLVERIGKNEYAVRWDFSEDGEEIEYNEKIFPYRPSLEVIKKIILSLENAKIDQKILDGYVWKGMSVWLSSENQFNYKAAYDIAIQTSGANLPLIFKFGSTENPEYYQFTDLQDLSEFYFGAMGFINNVLAEGWTKKDSISWEGYENALEEL